MKTEKKPPLPCRLGCNLLTDQRLGACRRGTSAWLMVQRSALRAALCLAVFAIIASCAVAHLTTHSSVATYPGTSDALAAECHSAAATTVRSSPMASTKGRIDSIADGTPTTAPHHDVSSANHQNMTGLHPSAWTTLVSPSVQTAAGRRIQRQAKPNFLGKNTFPDSGTIAAGPCSVQRKLSPPRTDSCI